MVGHEEHRQDPEEEVVRRNVEQARDLLAARRREQEQRPAEPPLRDDPPHGEQEAIPDQDNVSMGGTTGSQMNLGGNFRSGRRRKG